MVKKAKELDDFNGQTKIKIAVGGNCNTDFLSPALKVRLATQHIESEVMSLEYDSWLQTVQLNKVEADVWVIWLSSLGATNGGTKPFALDLDQIIATLTCLVDAKKKVMLVLPERMDICADYYSPLFQQYQRIKNQLIAELPSSVLVIDPEIIHATLGSTEWYAARYWTTSKLVCHPDAIAALSWYMGNILAKSIKPEVKAVIVDLDNTLWGGVVGEDGTDNLLLDVNTEGRPFIQMQFFLKHLSDQGIPISVVSKNNLEDAKLPFLHNQDMLLTLDDFVYFTANWEHKSKNIEDIARKLKLNLDAICFIDDSVYERTEVRAALPTLIVPELPSDPDERVGMLVQSGLFTTPHVSSDDIERASYYKSDVKRESFLSNVLSFDDYLNGLDMILEPQPIDDTNLQRVISLIHRTNQFNLTNRRHALTDLREMLDQKGIFAYCYKLKDKFGDSGTIGVLLAKKVAEKMCIDTFLMSCRVLNRKVEYAIFAHFIGWLNERGMPLIEGEYNKSAKNALVQDLYLNLGLNPIKTDEEGNVVFSGGYLTMPTHPLKIQEIGGIFA